MNELLQLRIEKAIYGGAGLARHEGRAVFTPFTLPGELVEAAVTKAKGSFAEAALSSVLEPAPARVSPPCPYFGTCGGCHYQHAAYKAQLAMKAAILEETLTRAHLTELPLITTHPSESFGYRNRIRLHLDPQNSALGYRERGTHRLLPVSTCPIAAPELQHALGELWPLSASLQLGRLFSGVELCSNHDGSQLLLGLWLRTSRRAEAAADQLVALCSSMLPKVPALRGGGIYAAADEVSAKPSRGRARSHGTSSDQDATLAEEAADRLSSTWGEPSMTYRVGDRSYEVGLGAFFQVNRTLVDALVFLVTSGRRGGLAWDLYAGVGLFSKVLAATFEQVIAVEGSALSFGNLRANLGGDGVHQAVRSSTLAFLERQLEVPRQKSASATMKGGRKQVPEFVVVDPPRAGLGTEVTQLLARAFPAEITYVSCDPATLSRDLRTLVESGYQIKQLHLIDLFPQTFHLETVVMLSRV